MTEPVRFMVTWHISDDALRLGVLDEEGRPRGEVSQAVVVGDDFLRLRAEVARHMHLTRLETNACEIRCAHVYSMHRLAVLLRVFLRCVPLFWG